MVGTGTTGNNAKSFSGIFNGGGHTLTFNYHSNEQYTAPFRYIENAEISNLRIDGNITTGRLFAAGFVANAKGNNTITNCRSSVTINSDVYGDGSHGGFVSINQSGIFTMEGCVFDGSLLGSTTNNCGGFVANCQNNADDKTTVTFTRCVFNGKLLGTGTDNCGGFVGWTEGNDWAGVKFIDCIFAPSEVSVQSDGSATFSRGRLNNSDHITVENSYYTQRLGAMQGEMAYTSQPANATFVTMTIAGITIYVKKALVTNVAASDITPTEATISCVWETENKSILFLGAANTLYFPQPSGDKIPHLNAFRAYFQLSNGLTAGDVASARLYFDGEDTQTGMGHTEITDHTDKADAWYSLDGRKLQGQPTQKGLYIHGVRKVAIK